jgi:tetratricopeptide (TPR) repeat protein
MDGTELVAGRFFRGPLVAEGGMGKVFRARDRETGAEVALKILDVGDAEAAKRFVQEAAALSELEHYSIVRYVAHGLCDAARAYLAMEWLEGETLAASLARGPIGLGDLLLLAKRTAQALGHAHDRGIVHRDIKPSNLFLVNGGAGELKVIDFGIARQLAVPRATQTGIALGTPGYMAPEQARGDSNVTASADVFALGCVLFECLTGRPAFVADHPMALLAKILVEDLPTLTELVTECPKALDTLLRRMLDKEPSRRPANGWAVAEAIAAVAEGTLPGTEGEETPLGLTARERRLVSVIALAPGARAPTRGWQTTAALVAQRHGGKLHALRDGSAIVLLPAGDSAADQAAQAASCALALHDAGPALCIGLATGRAEIRSHFPVGDAIDRATSLVVSTHSDDRVRVDAQSADLLTGRFDLAPGGSGPTLLGRRRIEAPRTLLGRETPCVGRDAELTILEARLAEVESESVARAVLITGPAGIGKSRVAGELLRRLRSRDAGVTVWSARGDSLRRASPFHLLGEALQGVAAMLDGEPHSLRARKLEQRVARHMTPERGAHVASFLGEVLGVPFDAQSRMELGAARRDPRLMADQIRGAWLELFDAECSDRPLLLLLDDLQWADRPSITLLDAALERLAERPLMILALARPEIRQSFPDLWSERGMVTVPLAGLARKASERLVTSTVGQLDKDDLDRLIRLAGGNAFFLEELIRRQAEAPAPQLPDSVLALAESRLENLDAESRRLLRAASVFGSTFWRGGLLALLSGAHQPAAPELAETVSRRLDDLVRHELVTDRPSARFAAEREWSFRHSLLREATYATLTENDRRRGHALAAGWLEAAGETDPAVLAEHFDLGGMADRAAGCYLRAAQQALDGNDFDATLERAAAAVRCGAEGELLGLARGIEAHALNWSGQLEPALAAAAQASELLPRASDAWCSAVEVAALASGALGRVDVLTSLGNQLLAEVRATTPAKAPLVAAAAMAANRLDLMGCYALSEALLVAAEAAQPSDGVTRAQVVGRLLHAKATQASRHGHALTFLHLTLQARDAYQRLGDQRHACHMHHNVGFGYLELGAHEDAERELRVALAEAERMGLAGLAVGAKQNLGVVMMRTGRLDEAIALEREAAASFRAHRDTRRDAGTRIYLALALTWRGELGEAEAQAREAVGLLDDFAPLRAMGLASLGNLLLAAGRNEEALGAARAAHHVFTHLGSIEEGAGLVRLVYAEALYHAGHLDEARQAIAEAASELAARAALIDDERFRSSFLERIPEHARIRHLAASWLRNG